MKSMKKVCNKGACCIGATKAKTNLSICNDIYPRLQQNFKSTSISCNALTYVGPMFPFTKAVMFNPLSTTPQNGQTH